MAQAPLFELPTRLPLVIEPSNRNAETNIDARLVNCFMETHGDETWIYKKPGYVDFSSPPGAPAVGMGCYNWEGHIYSIFDGVFYKDTTSIGAVDGTNGVYRFDSCLGATHKLVFGNGVKGYVYDAVGGLAEITGGAFPTGDFCKGWAYVDGTEYVMAPTDADIFGSDINDPTTWGGANVIQAQIEPDRGVALAKQLVYVVALKQWSTEIFFDAKNPAPASPLGPVQGAKVNFGCLNADGVQNLEGILIWPAVTRNGSVQVVMLQDLKIKVISTKAIERILCDDIDLSSIASWNMSMNGHRFYGLTLRTANLTLVYDIRENLWWQMTDTNGNYYPFSAMTYTNTFQHIGQHESDGHLYYIDIEHVLDNGAEIAADIYTPNFDGGTRRRKMLSRLELIGDQTPGSIIRVRANDHDYDPAKWTNFRTLDMSKQRPFITDCGTFVRRVHHFRHQSPTRMRISAAELQMELGTL